MSHNVSQDFLKTIIGVDFFDLNILEECDNVIVRIYQGGLTWYGHVQRMGDDVWPGRYCKVATTF